MENFGIDIESPIGELFTDTQTQQNHIHALDIELPEGYVEEQQEVIVEEAQKEETAHEHLTKKRHHMGIKAKNITSNVAIYIILILMTVVWLLPFVGIVFDSFRVETPGRVNYFIPKQWGFDNYINLFNNTNFKYWFGNTFLAGVVVSIVQTLFVLAMSYVLSRMRFKGRKGLMNFMLILGMFPGFLTLILLYKLLSDVGLTEKNSVFGLILVYVASSGMGYYVSKGYFDTIPRSLDEAARVDGANRAQVMFKVILPMAKPIVIYTILMGFMAPWGDFVMAKYIAHNTSLGYNVAAGLQSLLATDGQMSANYTTFCAGGVVVAIPIATLFMFLHKYYVAGVTGGAVKG